MQNRACRESRASGKLSESSRTLAPAEANLGRKASSHRRPKKPPTVVEGRVRKRNDESNDSSLADEPSAPEHLAGSVRAADQEQSAVQQSANQDAGGKTDVPLSPARARASDQSVKRATSGLMRLESRRKLRTWMRRSLYLALLAAPIAGLIYFFAEEIVDLIVAYWERIQAKLPPADAAEVPRR